MPGIAIGGLAGSTATTVHHGCGCEGRGERQRQTGLVNGFVEYVTEGSSSPEARRAVASEEKERSRRR